MPRHHSRSTRVSILVNAHFSGLYNKSRDSSDFPWILDFEAAHPQIKKELMALRNDKGFQPYRGPAWSGGQKAKDGVGFSSHKHGNWNVFYLQLHAMEFITNVEKVPVLMALLKKHLPRPFNHCFVSALTPGTHITPHYGPNNKKLRFHLPIMGCEGACLKVNGQTIELKEGTKPQLLCGSNVRKGIRFRRLVFARSLAQGQRN